jgi:hypothetical protein
VKQLEYIHPVEYVFVVVTFGFMLDEFAASKEHGWTGEPSSPLPKGPQEIADKQSIPLM